MSDFMHDRVVAAVGDLYDIGAEIGRGGMGVVYQARDVRLRRQIAIKVLPPELGYREDVKRRFLREAETAAQLSHAHIVPIYSVDERDGLVFFVMALVAGESVAARLARDRRPPIALVRRVLSEVADALAYAHSRGVVHRDIKPDNILLDRDTGRAMVTDFGIARAAEADGRLTVTGIAVGTPAYMSPEQALGEREVDGRSDIYSLGIVGYQMLAGAPPFTATNTPAMLMKHLSERPRPLAELRADVPPALAHVIERALAKSADDRWADAGAMRDALDADAPPAPRRSANGRAGADDADAGAARRSPLAVPPAGTWAPSVNLPNVPPPPLLAREDWRAMRRQQKDQWREQEKEWRDQWRYHRRGLREFGRGASLARYEARPLPERAMVFRRKFLGTAATLTFLGVINMGVSPDIPWVIFPAVGMGADLMSRWGSLRRAGLRFWDTVWGREQAALGAGETGSVDAVVRQRAPVPPAGGRERDAMSRPHAPQEITAPRDAVPRDVTPLATGSRSPARVRLLEVESRVAKLRKHAKVTAALAGTAIVSGSIGATWGIDPLAVPFALGGFGATIGMFDVLWRARKVRRSGVRLRDAFSRRWREAVARLDTRSRAARIADVAGELAAPEVLASVNGGAIRRAAEDRATILDIIDRLPATDRALIPDVIPTVNALVTRVAELATSLHNLATDVQPEMLAQLDARISAAKAEPANAPDRERKLVLLDRQRTTIADLLGRRSTLAGQLESAALVLENMRLDLLKLRSAGVQAAIDGVTSATQEARALSRDIGHVLDAAAEVRRL
jgi:serine/threonine-protein kinase